MSRKEVEIIDFAYLGEEFRALILAAPETSASERLTATELEVARLVAEGHSAKAIARERGTSPRTVHHQLARTYEKLGVSSRTELCLALNGQGGD